MTTLSKEQKQTLIEIVAEEFGDSLEYDEFVEAVMNLCEDIAGLESIQPRQIETLVKSMWRSYHDH